AASKKISKIRRRISGRNSVRNPGANSLTSDSEYITSSNNAQQKEKVNLFQQEDLYFAGQSTNYKQESPKMENDLLINNEE
ncbi:21466_t:CDS:1, partial [Gigaspora rosea]